MLRCHELYQIGQACPWWKPDDLTGFEMLAMVKIHALYEEFRLKNLARMMGAKLD